MSFFKLQLVALTAAFLFLGCAAQPKKLSTEKRYDVAIASIDSADDQPQKKGSNDDVNQLLNTATYSRFRPNNSLIQSSQSFLIVDSQLAEWEKTTAEKLNGTLLEFMAYTFGGVGKKSAYELRPYESTMLGFNLSLNHAISGRFDLAGVEARKIVQREQFIEALNERIYEAVKEQEKFKPDDPNLAPDARVVSKIELIDDYPIEIFKSKKQKTLKNSYQSAAATYLSGYVFEAEGDLSLALPAYKKGMQLSPDSALFKNGIANLGPGKKLSKAENTSDVLFIFELGLAPTLDAKKYRYSVPTKIGIRYSPILLPTIANPNDVPVKLGKIYLDGNELNPEQMSDIGQMVRQDLKDSMPKYVAMATTKALLEISSQVSLAQFTKIIRQKDSGLTQLLGSAVIAGIYSGGEIDSRVWDTLPEFIYMVRMPLGYGKHSISFSPRSRNGVIDVVIDKPYQIINIRSLDGSNYLAGGRNQLDWDTYYEKIMLNISKTQR